MIRARYIGSAPAQVMDTPYKFTVYGQSVGMPEDVFNAARAGRIALLTEEEFQALGHTPEELAAYSRFESHAQASQEFMTRVRQGWQVFQTVTQPTEVTNG